MSILFLVFILVAALIIIKYNPYEGMEDVMKLNATYNNGKLVIDLPMIGSLGGTSVATSTTPNPNGPYTPFADIKGFEASDIKISGKSLYIWNPRIMSSNKNETEIALGPYSIIMNIEEISMYRGGKRVISLAPDAVYIVGPVESKMSGTISKHGLGVIVNGSLHVSKNRTIKTMDYAAVKNEIRNTRKHMMKIGSPEKIKHGLTELEDYKLFVNDAVYAAKSTRNTIASHTPVYAPNVIHPGINIR